MNVPTQWFLFSGHDSVLLHIAANPDCTTNEIADGMALTRDSVSRTMRDLSRAGVLYIREDGGQPRYAANLDCPFLHPSIKGYTLRYVLGQMAEQGRLLMAAVP